MLTYDMPHTVTFEETNVVGNVYYVNHVRWQGRCRELFLRDHAPSILDRLRDDLVLVTTRCACEYLAELAALDEVTVRMSLRELTGNRIVMGFDYWRGDTLVARGEQEVRTMRRADGRIEPAPVPPALATALEPFRG